MAGGEHNSLQDQHISWPEYLSNFSTASLRAVLLRYRIPNKTFLSLLLQSSRVEVHADNARLWEKLMSKVLRFLFLVFLFLPTVPVIQHKGICSITDHTVRLALIQLVNPELWHWQNKTASKTDANFRDQVIWTEPKQTCSSSFSSHQQLLIARKES